MCKMLFTCASRWSHPSSMETVFWCCLHYQPKNLKTEQSLGIRKNRLKNKSVNAFNLCESCSSYVGKDDDALLVFDAVYVDINVSVKHAVSIFKDLAQCVPPDKLVSIVGYSGE